MLTTPVAHPVDCTVLHKCLQVFTGSIVQLCYSATAGPWMGFSSTNNLSYIQLLQVNHIIWTRTNHLSITYPLVWFITTMFITFTCLSPFWLVLWFKSMFWNFLRRWILKINQYSLRKHTDKWIITVTVTIYPDIFLNEGKQNFWRTSCFLQEKM
jgi:hypothetical protein